MTMEMAPKQPTKLSKRRRQRQRRLGTLVKGKLPWWVIRRRQQQQQQQQSQAQRKQTFEETAENDNLVTPVVTRIEPPISRLTGRSYQTNQLDTPAKRWLSSLARTDPRRQINTFFLNVAEQGAAVDRLGDENDILLRIFSKASVFTVWRPCSVDAIRKMITGTAVGKGLEIKGKSAKQGKLSGFVPYLQIHQQAHKRNVGTLPKNGRTRIFYDNPETRNAVYERLLPDLREMVCVVHQAKRILRQKSSRRGRNGLLVRSIAKMGASTRKLMGSSTRRLLSLSSSSSSSSSPTSSSSLRKIELRRRLHKSFRRVLPQVSLRGMMGKQQQHQLRERPRLQCQQQQQQDDHDDHEKEQAMQKMIWEMEHPFIQLIDDYAQNNNSYGIELPDRLMWKAFVMDQSIERTGDWCTGRPSEPAFQDMNHHAIHKASQPRSHSPSHSEEDGDDSPPTSRVVLYQTDNHSNDGMDARSLVMAYEERGRVRPVVSDFDCFTMGTRGVRYSTPLPPEQAELLQWCVSNVQGVLERQQEEQQKEQHNDDTTSGMSWTARWLEVLKASAVKGFQPVVPRFGFGDQKSYEIMEAAVGRLLSQNGAVRHGAECFNYVFPQELDEEFLVISDMLPGKVPWKYVKLGELQDFLGRMIDQGFTFPLNPKWVLCDPGFKRIYDNLLASQRPNVQESLAVWYPPESGIREQIQEVCAKHAHGYIASGKHLDPEMSGTEAMDLAKLQLNRYLVLQRAKRKLRAVMMFKRLARRKKSCAIQEANEEENRDDTVYQEAIESDDTEFFSSRENDDGILQGDSWWWS